MSEHRHESSMEHVGVAILKIGNKLIDKNINVLIREIDAKQQEIEATKERVGDKWRWIDREARNCFHGGIETGILKYSVGYNHHRKRNGRINNRLVSTKCLKC